MMPSFAALNGLLGWLGIVCGVLMLLTFLALVGLAIAGKLEDRRERRRRNTWPGL